MSCDMTFLGPRSCYTTFWGDVYIYACYVQGFVWDSRTQSLVVGFRFHSFFFLSCCRAPSGLRIRFLISFSLFQLILMLISDLIFVSCNNSIWFQLFTILFFFQLFDLKFVFVKFDCFYCLIQFRNMCSLIVFVLILVFVLFSIMCG